MIGHSISVMGVQAGAVRRVLDPGLERERETLLAVERTGRDAVTEMRRLLALLRSDDAVPAESLPTLGRAAELVSDMRRAGLDVELELDGDLEGLPPGRALAGYRILQEALTNALKHAPGGRCACASCARLRTSRSRCTRDPLARAARRGRSGPRRHARASRAVRRRAAVGPTADGGFRGPALLPLGGEP